MPCTIEIALSLTISLFLFMVDNIAIDIGSLYCTTAFSLGETTTQIYESNDGSRNTPICLYYSDDKIQFGYEALSHVDVELQNIFYSALNIIGKKVDDPMEKPIFNFPISYSEDDKIPYFITRDLQVKSIIRPEKIIGVAFRSIIKSFTEKYDHIPKEIGITIPAYFSWSQQHALYNCCQIAGIEPVFIRSPVAALLGANISELDGIHLVVNVDVDSCSASLVRVKNNNFHIMGSRYELNFGIKQLDREFAECLKGKAKYKDRCAELKDPIQTAKKIRQALSSQVFINTTLELKSGEAIQIGFYQAIYDNDVRHITKLFHDLITNLLKDRLQNGTVSSVLIVGQEARSHIFSSIAQEVTGIQPFVPPSPEDTTAIGAVAFLKNGQYKVRRTLPQSIGLCVDSDNGRSKVTMVVSNEGEDICGKTFPPVRFQGQGPLEVSVVEGIGDYSLWHTIHKERLPFEGNLKEDITLQVDNEFITLCIGRKQIEIQPASGFYISDNEIKRIRSEVDAILEPEEDELEEYSKTLSKARLGFMKQSKAKNLDAKTKAALKKAINVLIPQYRSVFSDEEKVDPKKIRSKMGEFLSKLHELGLEMPK